MRTFAFIFARGGSKGLPRKNLRLLGGKPLIAWAIDSARGMTDIVERVIVSTDDEEIAEVARHYGAEVPFIRPASLATDTAGEWKSWQHAVDFVGADNFDFFLSVPPTAPLREREDLVAAVDLLKSNPEKADMVITGTPAQRHPYFNMVKSNDDGTVSLLGKNEGCERRQDAPEAFDVTTVAYVTTPEFVQTHSGVLSGRTLLLPVSRSSAVDIDTEFDLEWAEFLLNKNKKR